jgi:type I restriction enzyme S subunit
MPAWKTLRLGDVCEMIKRGIGPKYLEEDGICVINQKCVRDHSVNYDLARRHDVESKKVNEERYVKAGDVLVNSTGTGTLGRVAQVKVSPAEPTTADTHVTIVRPKPNFFYDAFFGYMLIKIEEEITSAGEGASGQTELARAKLENEFFVSYPDSIPEQQRIVAILDQAFADIEKARANAEQNLKNARELFDSYLNSLLLEVCSEKPSRTLNCISELIVDCEHKTAPVQDEGYPSIRTPNIGRGHLLLDNVRRVSEETYHLWTRRAVPTPGDLILAREAPAGNVGVIPDNEKVCLGQRTVLIRPMKSEANSQYLAYFLLHPIMQSRLLAHSTGATVQHVNMKDIRQLPVAKFPSLTDQLTTVNKIRNAKNKVQTLENIYVNKLASLDELKKSLLQKAFSGELTKSKGIAA